MAGGINISFLSNVKDFLRGTKDVEGALDDVSDALDDVARDAKKTGEKAGGDLGDGIKDGGRDAERALDDVSDTAKSSLGKIGDHADDAADETKTAAGKMERTFRDAFDTVKTESKTAGDDVSKNTKKGFDDAGEGAKTFKDEANSTATEVAASFDGSTESIAGGFQELSANALAGFGPAGAVAGLAVAAGLGVAFSKFTENSEAAKQRISDMADEMISANARVLGADFINDQLKAIYTDADGAAIKLSELKDASQDTGVAESTLARAFAGDQNARAQAISIVQAKYADASADAVSLDNETAASGVVRMHELGQWRDELGVLGTDYDSASGKAAGYQDAVSAAQTSAQTGVGETRLAYEALHRSVDEVPKSKTITIDADTSLAEARLATFRANLSKNNVVITAEMRAQGGYEANRASGGLVGGQGSDIDDRVKLNASPGEYVLDAQAVQQIGVGRLDQMNNGQMSAAPMRQAPARPTTNIQIDVHPSAGLDERQIATMVGREAMWLMR